MIILKLPAKLRSLKIYNGLCESNSFPGQFFSDEISSYINKCDLLILYNEVYQPLEDL